VADLQILDYMERKKGDILHDLQQFVMQDSPSTNKDLVDQCGGYLKQLIFDRLNAHVEEYPNDKVGNHMKFEWGEGDEQILILAHYDTVWEKGTLSFRIEQGKAYGPGILDMKGGIIQAIWALKALDDLQIKPRPKVVFLLTSDEEQLSPTSRELIEEEAKKCRYVLVVEPAAGTGALKTARKGAGKYKIWVHGISSHAGNHPNVQASAIHELAHQIKYLETLADSEKGTSINVGVIKGGTMSNVVAESAEAEIDVRFYTKAEEERITKAFSELQPLMTQTKLKVEGGINRPPMEKSKQSAKLFELAQECAYDLGFSLTEASVGGVSDGNFTAAVGVPTLDGIGSVGEGPHAIHEHVIIEEIHRRSALLASLLQKI
jgi:glutamate carboxypeptidase